MQLKATHGVEKGIITTTIEVDTLGSDSMSADEEAEVLNDYNIEINYGSIIFSRYVKINDHKDPEIVEITPMTDEEQPDGEDTDNEETEPQTIEADLVTLAISDDTFTIEKDMKLKYAVDVDTLEDRLSNYNYFEDTADLAKAMILVFESCVTAYIHERLEFAKKHRDAFEGVVYYQV